MLSWLVLKGGDVKTTTPNKHAKNLYFNPYTLFRIALKVHTAYASVSVAFAVCLERLQRQKGILS